MSASSAINTVLDKVVTQLETINGSSSDFYFNIRHSNIIKGWRSMEQLNSYPAIRVTSPVLTDIRPTDQVTFEGNFILDIYGAVESTKDVLEEGMKLFSDIERALLANPELDSTVWGMSIIHVAIEDGEDKAGVLVRVSTMLEYDSSS